MIGQNPSKDWKKWGKNNPYFGVISEEKFRLDQLDAESKNEFFKLGNDDFLTIQHRIKLHLNPSFNPQNTLDFGCGVGRLLIPFSQISKKITGVDVSENMLLEAEKNCEERNIKNAAFHLSGGDLSQINEQYDFIYSLIVFQHIPVKAGMKILKQLLEKLEPGGIAVLHFNYGKQKLSQSYGKPSLNIIDYLFYYLDKTWKIITGHKDPEMRMYYYKLDDIMYLFQQNGAHRLFTYYTDHGGELGAVFYFKKVKKQTENL
jgi:ubiquinone/menaquinone biosynthesis C-methylase UbiE